MVFIGRDHIRLAVKGTAGRAEDDLADTVVDTRFEHVEPADNVHMRVVARLCDRPRYLGLRGVVVDHVRPEGRDCAFDLR